MTRTAISARRFEALNPQSHVLDDAGFLMCPGILLAAVGACAEPTLTLDGMWQFLGAWAQSVSGTVGSAGSEITVFFSIKRDGSLQGQPGSLIRNSLRMMPHNRSYSPVRSAASLAVSRLQSQTAVAGRPLRLRVMSRARERGA
jgi:hypothetical protein